LSWSQTRPGNLTPELLEYSTKIKKKTPNFQGSGSLIGFVLIYQPLASEPEHILPASPLGVVGSVLVFKFKVFIVLINIDKDIKKSIL
jgi:hypothetical protein